MQSLRLALQQIGEPRLGKNNTELPHGFACSPASLAAAIRCMTNASPAKWKEQIDIENSFGTNVQWASTLEGVTNDGQNWYVSFTGTSNTIPQLGVFKLSREFRELSSVGFTGILNANHLGDIDYSDGYIFGSLERGNLPGGVVVIDAHQMKVVNCFELPDTPQMHDSDGSFHCPWIAVNPWNKLLYSSTFADDGTQGVSVIPAFSLDGAHVVESGFINMFGWSEYTKGINRVQGGIFTPGGHFVLSSDAHQGFNGLHCFSALNGRYMGVASVPSYNEDNHDELQGLTWWPLDTQIHLASVSYKASDSFDAAAYLKHFTVTEIA